MSTCEQQSVLDRFAKRARRLYTLPAVALKVVELTRDPDLDPQALKACIENDPSLATRVLRVANSSVFGLSQQVADLSQAVKLLGTKPLKLLVLGFSLPKTLFTGLEARVLTRYWRRTLVKAVAAREISESLWKLPGEEAFLGGLLQDVGMLALAQDLSDAYGEFLERIALQGGDLAALEVAALGFDHAVLSGKMLEHWGLPETFTRAVACPHNAAQMEQLSERERDLAQILHLAELVSEFLVQQQADLLHDLLEAGEGYRGLTIQQLEDLVRSLEQKVPQLAQVLSLELPGKIDYGSVLWDAHRQLSELTEEGTAPPFGDTTQESAVWEQAQSLEAVVKRSIEFPAHDDPAVSPNRRTEVLPAPATAIRAGEQSLGMPARQAVEQALLPRVSAAVGRCRQGRRPICLLLLELDAFGSPPASDSDTSLPPASWLLSTVEAATEREVLLVPSAAPRLALLLEGRDRQQGVQFARQLVADVREWSLERGGPASSISAGLAALALPPRNFPAQALIEAAERCLHGVQLSGGDGVKSIDIC